MPPLVRYQLAVSLDGFIGPEDGSVDWLGPFGAVAEEVMTPFIEAVGGLAMGRVTYETAMRLGGWPFSHLPTAVLSSATEFEGTHRAESPRDAVDWLAPRVGEQDIWLVGGGRTAAAFANAGLLDRIELTTVPVALGSGEALLPGLIGATTFRLESARPGPADTVISVYASIEDGSRPRS